MSDDEPESQAYPKPGEILEGKYEIQRILGEGAMGAVMRATHVLRKAPVALKFMSPNVMKSKGIVDRFLNEGVAASAIDSDHVVKIYDVSKLPSGLPYMVMEYLEGEDLQELLEREGEPGIESIPRCVHFVTQILRGLQVAHRAGIVHRDMKPANCFVTKKDGEPDFIKLVDFGISKLQQPDAVHLTDVGTSLGTPLYMSPEQARNPKDVDSRADLYAAATILYELLTGRTPFIPESGLLTELLFKLGMEEPPRVETFRPDLPLELCEIIHHGLVKDPAKRFQSAAEFAEALAPFSDDRTQHVLSRMLHRRVTGHSQLPPHAGPPTHVDEKRPSHARISVRPPSQADLPGETQPLAGTIPVAAATMRSVGGGTEAMSDSGAMSAADTSLSTSQDASDAGTGDKPKRSMLYVGVASGALTLVLLAVLYSSMSSGPTVDSTATPAAPDPGIESNPEPEVTPAPTASVADVDPTPTAEPTAAPTASPVPDPVASATVAKPPTTASPPAGTAATSKPTLGSITIKD